MELKLTWNSLLCLIAFAYLAAIGVVAEGAGRYVVAVLSVVDVWILLSYSDRQERLANRSRSVIHELIELLAKLNVPHFVEIEEEMK